MSEETQQAILATLANFMRLADEPSAKVLAWLLSEYGEQGHIASFVDLLNMGHGKFRDQFALEIQSAIDGERQEVLPRRRVFEFPRHINRECRVIEFPRRGLVERASR